MMNQALGALAQCNNEAFRTLGIGNSTNIFIYISEMFLGLICWSLERKFPKVTHISTEQLDLKIKKQR